VKKVLVVALVIATAPFWLVQFNIAWLAATGQPFN
jgi:hypothetical protein